jgi:DNA (cytosine-5)-methyltransferase 1
MIEFYHKYFIKSYRTKVLGLCHDITRLLELENIALSKSTNGYILPDSLQANLDASLWAQVNILYQTLATNEDLLSDTLKKFQLKKARPPLSRLSFIDTFAGCGGLSLGMSKAGFSPLMVNEIEPKYLESYYFNHGLSLDQYHCGDIKDFINDHRVKNIAEGEVDLIVGGPPCQGFSMANRQRIIDDPRNVLYKRFLELLARLKPKFFVMENVKGMMNKTDEILETFNGALGDEYRFDMQLLNARDYGIPQNRQRVFVIGTNLNGVNPSDIFANIAGKKYPTRTLQEALDKLPKLEPKRTKNQRGIENDDIGYKFRPTPHLKTDFLASINTDNSADYLANHTNRYNNDRDIEIFGRLPQGANSLHDSIKDIMPYSGRNHIFKDKYYKLDENQPCKTITSHMKLDCNMYIHPQQPRGLSPREAARVQTFPDNYIFMGANNTWYAQIGNAVPVLLAKAIGTELAKHLNHEA